MNKPAIAVVGKLYLKTLSRMKKQKNSQPRDSLFIRNKASQKHQYLYLNVHTQLSGAFTLLVL